MVNEFLFFILGAACGVLLKSLLLQRSKGKVDDLLLKPKFGPKIGSEILFERDGLLWGGIFNSFSPGGKLLIEMPNSRSGYPSDFVTVDISSVVLSLDAKESESPVKNYPTYRG